MKRVMIIGGPGSGKSTVAVRLGAMTGLPVCHMDHIHWLPGWVQRDRAERIALAREVEAGEAWIFEGGLAATYDSRAARAEMIVFLDIALPVRLWRVTRRVIRNHGSDRPDLTPGCPERWDWEFMRYILRSNRANRARNAALIANQNGKPTRHLTTARAVDAWLGRVAANGLPG